jgi:hypothetical protein
MHFLHVTCTLTTFFLMISIICIYNDTKQLERYLIRGLKRQDADFELITVDNTRGQHQSAAPALNSAGSSACGDLLMFVHQDVELLSASWLRDAERHIACLPDFGAAGVAGRTVRGKMAARVWHGDPPAFVGKRKPMRKPLKVQTLDGCLAITPASVFRQVRFDENTCRGWHLFIADYCLTLRGKGRGVYVLPGEVYHRSTGPADICTYMPTVKAIIKKHGCRCPAIHTTVGTWHTHGHTTSLTTRMLNRIKAWCIAGKRPRQDISSGEKR